MHPKPAQDAKAHTTLKMEDFVRITIVSIVQAITELLPISSSAHVLISARIIGFEYKPQILDSLQIGSMLVIAYFYREIIIAELKTIITKRSVTPLATKILVSLIPAAVVGIIDRKLLHISTTNLATTSLLLAIGGLMFIIVEKFHPKPQINTLEAITTRCALKIGVIQILAVLPGFSRLGATIMASRLMGLDAKTSITFSFLMGLPLLGLTSAYDLITYQLQIEQSLEILFGIAMTALTSALVIHKLNRWLIISGLGIFGYYRLIVGAAAFITLTCFT